MATAPVPKSVILQVTQYLPSIEKVLLLMLLIGIALMAMKIDTLGVKAALLGLAVTFFLYAYRPNEMPTQENEQAGFLELFAWLILPKVLWISTSITTVGVVFYLSQLEGYKNMLTIGVLSCSVATIILLYFWATDVKHIPVVVPVLFRAIPIVMVGIYILFFQSAA